MGVGIYEARRNSVAPGKHFLVSRCTPKIANGDDPVARNSDIGIEARRAGPVENGGIADDQIAAQSHSHQFLVGSSEHHLPLFGAG
jgi:hypothetical protein